MPELDPFVEDNGRTEELLEFSRDPDFGPHHCYMMKRVRQRAESDREAETEEERTMDTSQIGETGVYIRKVVQGDKQPAAEPDSEH